MADLAVTAMLGFGLLLLLGMVIWMGFLTSNKDNGAEIQKQLGAISAVLAIVVGLFCVVSYVYFASNTNYLTPFLIIMTFFNTFLSLFAVSASTLQIAYL